MTVGSGVRSGRRRGMSLGAVAFVLGLVACPHLAFWALKNPATTAASVEDRLASVSYNRFAGRPSAGRAVPEARIRADLTAIAGQAKAVRTYASTQGLERVPKIAAELGLNVTLGAWIGTTMPETSARSHQPSIWRDTIPTSRVWSWAMKRCSGTSIRRAELIQIHSARETRKSGSGRTAENWRIFIEHPELGDAVDQIFAHIIPYWEGVPKETAVERSLEIYDQLQATFPGKTIVVGELGWPSAGRNFEQSMPGPITQAVVLRDFVARATALGIDYNIVEAIDQPEKLFEGNVGPYWGILNASLRPKFAWTGPLVDPEYWKAAGCAVLVGLLLSLSILLLPGATIGQVALLAGADHVIGDWCASVLGYWHAHYFLHGEVIAFGIGLAAAGPACSDLLSRVGELAAVTFGRNPERLLQISPPRPGCRHAKSLDPYSRLPGAAGDAVADHRIRWRGSNTRILNAWLSSTTRRIRRSGSRSRRAAANSVRVSSFCASRTCRVSRPQHFGLRWRRPLPMPRSLA